MDRHHHRERWRPSKLPITTNYYEKGNPDSRNTWFPNYNTSKTSSDGKNKTGNRRQTKIQIRNLLLDIRSSPCPLIHHLFPNFPNQYLTGKNTRYFR